MPDARRKPEGRSQRAFAIAFGGATLLAVALIGASLAGSRTVEVKPVPQPISQPSTRPSTLFRGIPQDGITLGSPDAPVTLVEYADLQCPYCAQWARDVLPAIVDEYVRPGRVRLVFRGLSFIGADSEKALRVALAAGEQNRLWEVVHVLFASQGTENSGWVTDGLLRNVAHTGIDADRMLARTQSRSVARELAAASKAAELASVPGTPFFQAGLTGGRLEPLRVTSLDAAAFRIALDSSLSE